MPFKSTDSSHHKGEYTEGNAWQWTWFAPHDVPGLIGQYAHGNEPSHHIAYFFDWERVELKDAVSSMKTPFIPCAFAAPSRAMSISFRTRVVAVASAKPWMPEMRPKSAKDQ